MKTSKIVLGFTKLRDGGLEDKALEVAAAMTGNTHFPDPSPSLAVLGDGIKKYQDALAASMTGDKVKILIKKDVREELEFILSNLAHYCSYVAQGNRAVLASSGFSLNADAVFPTSLSDPENFTVQLGRNAGEVVLSITSVAGAKAYIFLYGAAPIADNAWQHQMHTQPELTITGLEQGKTYSFRMGVVGSKGQTAYTDTITKMVVTF